MNLWAVTMVRDEMDILPFTLAHLVTEGVAGIIIADNRSQDDTTAWITRRGAAPDWTEKGVQVIVHQDDEVGYYQSRKMSALVAEAFDRGADWVIPFDADECWYSRSGQSLWAELRLTGEVDALEARLYNYFPTSTDPSPSEPNMDNPFERITNRDPTPGPLPKVAVRRPRHGEKITIAQGNHGACIDGQDFVSRRSQLTVGHFPWRSPEQFERKIRNGFEAYQATDLPDDMGAHWRGYGQILRDGGSAALRGVYDTWFHDPEILLERSPVPWLAQVHQNSVERP